MSNISFLEYQNKSSRTMNNDLALQESLCNWALGLSGEVGEVIEHIKKHCFHGKDLNYDEVEKEIGDVLWYVTAAAYDLGYELSEIAAMNIEKLQDRQKRHKLQGSGDHR